MLLQSPNCRQKLGDDSHFFGFQKCAESANDTEPVIFGEIPAEPFINQNKVRFVAQGFGDGVAFAGIQSQKTGIGDRGACNQANPLDLLQIRDDDGQPGFALFPDGFDNMELAMDGLKDVKPLNGCEGKKRCGIGVDFHSAVSRS